MMEFLDNGVRNKEVGGFSRVFFEQSKNGIRSFYLKVNNGSKSNLEDIVKIYNYCIENNIPVVDSPGRSKAFLLDESDSASHYEFDQRYLPIGGSGSLPNLVFGEDGETPDEVCESLSLLPEDKNNFCYIK